MRPLHFGRFAGEASIFNRDVEYKPADPLGVFLSEYTEGKRLYNSDAWLPEVAGRLGKEPAQVLAVALADAAAAAFRLHRLGWTGRVGVSTDMHAENVRLTADGRGQLVADFGAFEERLLSWEERADETLSLIGRPDPVFLADLVPLVVERLAGPSAEPGARHVLLTRQVRRELGL